MARRFVSRVQTFFGVAGLLALAVTAALIAGVNPLEHAGVVGDAVRDALERVRGPLAEPAPRWSERVDGPPVTAAVSGGHLVVVLRGAVEVRRLADGSPAWSRTVDWAAPAGDVVVAGRAEGGGFEVLDIATGSVRWQDARPGGVWPYRDVVLSTSCDLDRCLMRARATSDGRTRWRRVLDGTGHRIAGHPEWDSGPVQPDHHRPAPRIVGVVTGQTVTMLDTRSGDVLGRVRGTGDTRFAVVAGRVAAVIARAAPGGCRWTVRGFDPRGRELWRRAGYDTGTASGTGCEQHSDPVAAGGVLVASGADERPVLLGFRDGAVRWRGQAGATVPAAGARLAVVRNPRGDRLTGVDPDTGATRWDRPVSRGSRVMLTPHAVVVTGPDAVTALAPDTGQVLGEWRTQASPIGAGESGLVLASGRTVGYVAW